MAPERKGLLKVILGFRRTFTEIKTFQTCRIHSCRKKPFYCLLARGRFLFPPLLI